jgi:hypothetical protein
MSMLPIFRVPPVAPSITPAYEDCIHTIILRRPEQRVNPVEQQAEPIDPATSQRLGSITYDRQRRPTHEWSSLDEFHTWRMNEELDHGIELLVAQKRSSADNPLWREKRIYVCSRQGTGGKCKYARKHADRFSRTRSTKRTGCRCRIVVKMYHHVSTVLGWYRAEHDHATGIANLQFTRLPDSTRAHALDLLRTNVDPKDVVSILSFIYQLI